VVPGAGLEPAGHTRCGMLTEMRTRDLARVQEESNLRLGWFVRLRVWRQEKDYGPFELITRDTFFSERTT